MPCWNFNHRMKEPFTYTGKYSEKFRLRNKQTFCVYVYVQWKAIIVEMTMKFANFVHHCWGFECRLVCGYLNDIFWCTGTEINVIGCSNGQKTSLIENMTSLWYKTWRPLSIICRLDLVRYKVQNVFDELWTNHMQRTRVNCKYFDGHVIFCHVTKYGGLSRDKIWRFWECSFCFNKYLCDKLMNVSVHVSAYVLLVELC